MDDVLDIPVPDKYRGGGLEEIARQIIAQRKAEWLGKQDWHQGLTEKATKGAGMLEQLLSGKQKDGLSVYGSGGKSGAFLQGSGGMTYKVPLDDMQSLMFLLGGAGVRGNIQVPVVGQKPISAFLPEAGIRYERKF